MALTKKDLVESVLAKTDLNKKDVQLVVEEAFNSIVEGLKNDNDRKVSISGFGVFQAKDKPERMGRNPITGQQIKIDASISASWKPAKLLKDNLNNK